MARWMVKEQYFKSITDILYLVRVYTNTSTYILV